MARAGEEAWEEAEVDGEGLHIRSEAGFWPQMTETLSVEHYGRTNSGEDSASLTSTPLTPTGGNSM